MTAIDLVGWRETELSASIASTWPTSKHHRRLSDTLTIDGKC